MQAKLLRVLQDGEIRALGGERSHRVDVRIIAATHRDLAERVRRGTFREDLYYRLAVMVVPIPALRHRREDLPQLVAHFIEKHAKRKVNVERRAMARLVGYHWPGNVRQLENEVMRACVLAEGTIREEDLSPALLAQPAAADEPARAGLDLRRAVEDLERQMVHRALREHGGNQSRAAKALGLSRFGLQKKLKRLQSTARAIRNPDDGTEPPDQGTLARRSQ
jgi:serine/threonine-protein kinase PknK